MLHREKFSPVSDDEIFSGEERILEVSQALVGIITIFA